MAKKVFKQKNDNIPTRGILKIFQSLNLMGNRLHNVKVNEPIEDDDATNKIYIDKQLTYDTELVTAYEKPFLFPWVPSLLNDSYKSIFDKLFFPRILPTYENPTVEFLQFTLLNYEQKNNNNWLILNNKSINFSLKVKITDNDRIVTNQPLLVTYTNGSRIEIPATTFIDGIATFTNVSIIYQKQTSTFYLYRLYGPASTMKKDTYGDDYVPDAFKINYELNSELKFDFSLLESLLIRNQPLNELPPDIIDNDPVPDTFAYTNRIYAYSNSDAIVDILIPKLEYTNYCLKAYIYNNNGSKPVFIQSIYLPYETLQYYGNITLTKDGINYYYGQFNFGNYPYNIFVVIQMEILNIPDFE